LLYTYPYPVTKNDLRSPNIKMIDAEIERLAGEMEATGAFNQRVQSDRFYPWAKHVAAGIRWWLYFPVKYLTDGIDNHAFDTNSP
jgi:hypothetical protein